MWDWFANNLFGDTGSGTLNILAKIGLSIPAIITLVLGVWKLFIMRQPPGHAGVMLSWNNQMMIKRHRDNSCVADCGHTKKSRRRHRIVYWGKFARKVQHHRKHRFEILTYEVCVKGCECTHMMGKIVWPGLRFKWPWRKCHSIPIHDRSDVIDPATVDITDPETEELLQFRFEGIPWWRVKNDVTDDAPFRADHEIKINDLTLAVVRLVGRAAFQAEINFGITELNKKIGPPEDRGLYQRRIYECVNNLCKDQLDRYGVELYDFEIRESAQTPASLLASALHHNPAQSETTDTKHFIATVNETIEGLE